MRDSLLTRALHLLLSTLPVVVSVDEHATRVVHTDHLLHAWLASLAELQEDGCLMTQPRRIAFANQKGGVGKTATTLGLASAISNRGGRVLIIDMDPQASATEGMGVVTAADQLTTADLMDRAVPGSAIDAIVATPWDGVDVIPSHLNLTEAGDSGASDLVFRLDIALEGLDLSPYDAVFFDCPPSLGKLLFAVLLAVDEVVAVAEPERDAVRAVGRLEATIEHVKMRPNPRLTLSKIIISKRAELGEHIERSAELRAAYGDLVARTHIPSLAARKDAHSQEMPIHQYRRGKALSLHVAYDDLLDELGIKIGESK